MSWVWAALMPHPPIILPEVGRGREAEAGATLDGIKRLIEELRTLPKPEVLLVLSPHHPYAHGSLLLNNAPRITGNLGRFGAPEVSLDAEVPQEALERLRLHLAEADVPVTVGAVEDLTKDHGTLVPLAALAALWPEGPPPIIAASPSGLTPEQAFNVGKALRKFAPLGSWGLLAGGDLSHRLLPTAPAGYNPQGKVFDAAVVAALQSGNARPLLTFSDESLDAAGECGLRSVLILLGLAGVPLDVLSYEGPFGVGYCTALWDGKRPNPVHPYPALARLSVARHLRGAKEPSDQEILAVCPDASLWTPQTACFVSIKTLEGSLRGCIGTILPLTADLGREIAMNAVSAAARDPRFAPMHGEELAGVRFYVDVLNPPEPTTVDGLDPKRYGVIVSKNGQRGLLLPDLDGVETVEQQVYIAAQKAGIRELDGMEYQRFTVTRYQEE